jgi:hypothetical protein
MSVTFSPLTAQTGFSSPGFIASPTGDLILTGSISITGQITADSIVVNGTTVLNSADPTELNNQIITSSLTSLGTLTGLNIAGNLTVNNGTITMNSSSIGSINNITIGQTTPRSATFTTLTATGGNITTLVSDDIQADDIQADDISINNQPVELFHATRKDYVDNRVSAFSIAFGA